MQALENSNETDFTSSVLSFFYYLKHDADNVGLASSKATTFERFEPKSYINRGNYFFLKGMAIFFTVGNLLDAISQYKEALSIDIMCFEALYNIGIIMVSFRLVFDDAKELF